MEIQNRIAKMITLNGFYVSLPQAAQIFRVSPLRQNEDILGRFFARGQSKVNIMEVLAGAIVYSACNVRNKIKLAMHCFDFDNNKSISKDEMVIMCMAFIQAIGILTQNRLLDKSIVKELSVEAFYLADENPDGVITFEE
jgi:Ca2+-binding EF-hand superfamily protein